MEYESGLARRRRGSFCMCLLALRTKPTLTRTTVWLSPLLNAFLSLTPDQGRRISNQPAASSFCGRRHLSRSCSIADSPATECDPGQLSKKG